MVFVFIFRVHYDHLIISLIFLTFVRCEWMGVTDKADLVETSSFDIENSTIQLFAMCIIETIYIVVY